LVHWGRLDDNWSFAPATETWYFKAGLRERWTHLGHTVLYGEYLRNDDGNNFNVCPALTIDQCNAYNSTLKVWGLGIVQEIDAAAMSIWISYRHLQADDNLAGVTGTNLAGYKDFQYVKFGGLINY
jgi:hypothetical protein